ncbi:MAG: S1C family serine protease, partial [Planctomycetota bacterium]
MKRFFLAAMCIFILSGFLPRSIYSQEEKSSINRLQDAAISLYEKVKGSVVAIRCKAALPAKRDKSPNIVDYYGTGVIYSADGYIITSTSVVPGDGKEIFVTLSNGKEFPAELIGFNKHYNEVSLIKIDSTNMTYSKLGDSAKVQIGQLAFTVGNPYDCIRNCSQPAFSIGVVSAIYRLRGDGDYKGTVIETDAALNAGSDGGPLFNVDGEVVGILNLSYSYTRWLSVAVPINQITLILDDLKENREIFPKYGFI